MRNNTRYFLYIAAAFISLFLWNKWQIAKIPHDNLKKDYVNNINASLSESNAEKEQQYIIVETDLSKYYINPTNGTIARVELLHYPVTEGSDIPLSLMHEDNPSRFILQSSWKTSSGNSYKMTFSSKTSHFILPKDQTSIKVPLSWKSPEGIIFKKTFVFYRNKYEFSIKQEVENKSSQKWEGFPYSQLIFGQESNSGGLGQVYTFTGGVMSTPSNHYEKIKLKDFRENIEKSTKDGWVAFIQHYFLGALIPNKTNKENYIFYTRENSNNHYIGIVGKNYSLEPNEAITTSVSAYIGPKIQNRLQSVAPSLDKTVDYGWVFMIAQPMFYVLNFIHSILGNWGWSIIVMTILIKAVFFTPSAWAYKSMAKMRHLQPRMAQLREHYGDDRQALSKAIMDLYRAEKVNPASGCLPMLLQIPFFIAFYYVLAESVELRQAPWIFWIHDLSARDPYFILPVINASLMFLQQKLNPTPPDPMQAKVMMTLPLVFGFMFMWFPSGLVLYWTVSNGFSIIQQYIMNKKYGNGKRIS